MKSYKAPWSTSLIVVSVLATLLCLGLAIGVPQLGRSGHGANPVSWVGWLTGALIVGCALFTVRGYAVTPDAILVRRLLWTTRLLRAGLRSARFAPRAMRKSIRICGNGGFFSFTGFYWSRAFGFHRAYVTDPNRTVVLCYERRIVVVSPDAPSDFVRDLS